MRNKVLESKKNEEYLLKLEKSKEDIELEIENRKVLLNNSRKVKNLKIFKGIFKFAAPVLISSLVSYGASTMENFGHPFILDKEKYSKVYTLECDNNKGIVAYEEYKDTYRSYEIPKSTFTIYSKWIKMPDHYERYVYTYEEKNLTDIELYNSIISHKFSYAIMNYKPKKINLETSNNLVDDNIEEVSAKIYVVDEDDNIYVVETDFKNLFVTLLELVSTVVISSLIIISIKDNVIYGIRKSKADYNNQKELYDNLIFKLNGLNEKIENIRVKVKKNEKK